jgi:hypothetical protein
MRRKEQRQRIEQGIPSEAYELARTYRIGQPLAIYRLPLPWLRFCLKVPPILLIVASSLFVLRLALEISGIFQLRALHGEEQIFSLQTNLMVGLFAIFLSLAVIVLLTIVIRVLPRVIPKYMLACSGGLLYVCPKNIDVTRWEEVTGFFSTSKRHYRLLRSGKKPLSFGYPVERCDELADLIRQHIRTNAKNF